MLLISCCLEFCLKASGIEVGRGKEAMARRKEADVSRHRVQGAEEWLEQEGRTKDEVGMWAEPQCDG